VAVTIVFSGVLTAGLLKLLSFVVPLKVATREEGLGLDVSQHGEEAYARDEGAILILSEFTAESPAPVGVLAGSLKPEGGRA
jgi:ammonium transporter, Amt family